MFQRTAIAIETTRASEIGALSFDKDDEQAMDFVTAAANLRAYNFGIPLETSFKIKEMAGKIVPAISSSNCFVANIQVIEAVKILAKNYSALKAVQY